VRKNLKLEVRYRPPVLHERRRGQNVLSLNDDMAPASSSRYGVVQQPALMLLVAADLIGPQNHHSIKLTVLGLLHRQGRKEVRCAAAVLSAKSHISGDDCFNLLASELGPSQSVHLIINPRHRGAHRTRWRQKAQCRARRTPRGDRGKLKGRNYDMCLVAVIAFPVNRVRTIPVLSAGPLPNAGHHGPGKSSLQGRRDDGHISSALTPSDSVGQQSRSKWDADPRLQDPEALPVRRRLPIANGRCRSQQATNIRSAHLSQRFGLCRSLQPGHEWIGPQRLI
jgi:hypothetical protein